jgi:hypothetical protein
MDKRWYGRFAKAGVVAILALISAAVSFFVASPNASVALPAKPVVELAPSAALPPGAETAEMFAAMDRGDLAVRLMPEKDQQARLELENRTDRPLTMAVPATFGGRFIVAAPWPPQPVIGATPSGAGLFCIPPEKAGFLRTKTACLDESKPEPNPGMVYEVCRLEKLTGRPAVQKLCAMLGDHQTDPQALQAAVWHLNCDLSWRRLAARLRTLGGPHGTQRFFTPRQIEDGKHLAEVAMQ